MHRILGQVMKPSVIDDDKDSVSITIKVPDGDTLIYQFNMDRGRVKLTHQSHAPIAAVAGKPMICSGIEIVSTNRVFHWLGIETDVAYVYKKSNSMSELKDGVISFFPRN